MANEEDPTTAAPFVFSNGMKGLFCGHSFFIPVARLFDEYSSELAGQTNYDFPRHDITTFFRGGTRGSPLSLWNNDKDEIESLLAEGGWDLFGLTIHSDDPDPIIRLQDWFDLAISYNNPNVTFFLGVPWINFGAATSDADYLNYTSYVGDVFFEIVESLRTRYAPNHPVLMLQYGHTVMRMRDLFEDGTGPLTDDVTELLGARESAIYRDVSPGHAGDYAEDMSALLWMNWFYDVRVNTLISMAGTKWSNTDNVRDILEYSLELNEPYRWHLANEQPNLDDGSADDTDAEQEVPPENEGEQETSQENEGEQETPQDMPEETARPTGSESGSLEKGISLEILIMVWCAPYLLRYLFVAE